MNRPIPPWLENAVFYEIYPQSFCDSNGDGIGDLPGVVSKLDYVASLGVTGIWLNPFYPSPFYDAGYDVSDYCNVDPRYGTLDDARELFEEAGKRGIRIVVDLVPGHTSIEHPWFKASASAQPSPYDDYYIWNNSVWTSLPAGLKGLTGYGDRDGSFIVNFFWGQPALNYGFGAPDPAQPWQQPVDAPGPRAVREEMRKVMRFWLDQGASGFRVDMAESLVKGPGKEQPTVELWQEMRAWLEEQDPEAVLQAEWGVPSRAVDAGFHMDFLLHFGDPAYTNLLRKNKGFAAYTDPDSASYFSRSGRGNIMSFLSRYLEHRSRTEGRGYINIPTGNHDIAPRLARDRIIEDLRVIYAFLLTIPGVPFIYYGDEIGMIGQPSLPSHEGGYVRTQVRTPMRWTDGEGAGFSAAPADRLYLPVDEQPADATVATQEAASDSLLHFVRDLISFRRSHQVLGAAAHLEPLHAHADSPLFVYELSADSGRVVVVINPSDREITGTVVGEAADLSVLTMARCQGSIRVSGDSVTAGPVSFAILEE